MKNQIIFPLLFLVSIVAISCKKETISNRENLILGKWDCVDYADTVTNELKGRAPVFISDLYEKGYLFKKDNFMWIRDTGGDNKMYTDKRVDCQWVLSEDKLNLSLFFPNNMTETYHIIEMTRKKMILKGKEGNWAESGNTYIFEKQ